MNDDSSVQNGSARKSKVGRAHTFMTDSFRMAASVLGPNATRKAATINVPHLKLVDKDNYKKQPECQVCFITFSKFGQHHCRICGNAVCSSCSYSTINKQRACDKCAYHYEDNNREKVKRQVTNNLTGLCINYLGNKMKAQEELRTLDQELPNEEQKEQEKKANEDRMKKLNEKLDEMANIRKRLEEEIEKVKNS